jgi:hypothetical protein
MQFNQSIPVTDYLTWESCNDPRFDFDCPPPTPIANHLPDWFKNMRGNITEYLPEGFGADHTIRHCVGFRGLLDIGYTIPLPVPVGGWQTHFASGNLHPEMVHGTPWAEKPGGPWNDPTEPNTGKDFSPYRYRMKLLFWPWRARMAPGWRLMILPNPWEWHTEWQAFAGAPRPNYQFNNSHTGLGNYSNWELPIDENYNYSNIETVLAVHREHVIPAGTVTFWAVPVYDPAALPQ